MKYAIGYQQPENGEPFSNIVADYREHIAEVYFPWPNLASGRAALGSTLGAVDWGAQRELEENLRAIRDMGVRLDILFNANCYGASGISVALNNQVCSIIDYLGNLGLLPDVATTTSPFVATAIKKNFPEVETRASVNMRIDSTLAMGYLADIFDSYHIRRDLQRDLKTVALFSDWCKANGKTLCMLANSGCLRHCPAQSFHDNLVAHDAEIDQTKNVKGYMPHLCWKLYQNKENYEEILRCSWIRPEDIFRYEPYFKMVKLATRQHSHPRMVLGAYISGHYEGNLLDLLEPGFSTIFRPYAIDNTRFPDDWHTIATSCAANCTHCGKCTEVLNRVLVKARDDE